MKKPKLKAADPKVDTASRNARSVGAYADLKQPKGMLVYALIGDYKGRGRQRVILHEVELADNGSFGYGHKRCWNFPTGKGRKPRKAKAVV